MTELSFKDSLYNLYNHNNIQNTLRIRISGACNISNACIWHKYLEIQNNILYFTPHQIAQSNLYFGPYFQQLPAFEIYFYAIFWFVLPMLAINIIFNGVALLVSFSNTKNVSLEKENSYRNGIVQRMIDALLIIRLKC